MRCSIKKLVASGNWSNPAIWDGGTLPESDQIVILNGFNLNVDQNATVRAIRNDRVEFYSLGEIPQYYGENLAYGDPAKVGNIIMEGPFSPVSTPPWTLFQSNWTGVSSLFVIYVSPSTPFIAGYEFPVAKVINKVAMRENYGANVSRKIQDIEIQSSNDGETWVTLLEANVANQPGTSGYYVEFENTTAYTHYRVLIKTGYLNSNPIYLYHLQFLEPETSITTGTYNNGGLMTFDSEDVGGITLTLTDTLVGLIGGYSSGPVYTYAGTKDFTIVGNIQKNHAFGSSPFQPLIAHNGTGTLNIIGDIIEWDRPRDNYLLNTTQDRHYQPYTSRYTTAIYSNTTGTTNIIGFINQSTRITDNKILNFSNHNLNITGDLLYNYRGTGDNNNIIYTSNCTVNITGDIINFGGRWSFITSSYGNSAYLFYGANLVITGSYVHENQPNMTNLLENSTKVIWSGGSNKTISWIGKIETQCDGYAFEPQTWEGVMLSGPIVCSPYGWWPISNLRRINWIKNATNSYIQFRDNENMFLISPIQTPNPTYNLVSSDTLIDLPLGSDVRQGTTYGAGTFTGTLAVPPANRVSEGIPVDDTVGTGTVTAEDVWNYATANLNTDGSIGKRLKNAATVDSTGNQLTSLL